MPVFIPCTSQDLQGPNSLRARYHAKTGLVPWTSHWSSEYLAQQMSCLTGHLTNWMPHNTWLGGVVPACDLQSMTGHALAFWHFRRRQDNFSGATDELKLDRKINPRVPLWKYIPTTRKIDALSKRKQNIIWYCTPWNRQAWWSESKSDPGESLDKTIFKVAQNAWETSWTGLAAEPESSWRVSWYARIKLKLLKMLWKHFFEWKKTKIALFGSLPMICHFAAYTETLVDTTCMQMLWPRQYWGSLIGFKALSDSISELQAEIEIFIRAGTRDHEHGKLCPNRTTFNVGMKIYLYSVLVGGAKNLSRGPLHGYRPKKLSPSPIQGGPWWAGPGTLSRYKSVQPNSCTGCFCGRKFWKAAMQSPFSQQL